MAQSLDKNQDKLRNLETFGDKFASGSSNTHSMARAQSSEARDMSIISNSSALQSDSKVETLQYINMGSDLNSSETCQRPLDFETSSY